MVIKALKNYLGPKDDILPRVVAIIAIAASGLPLLFVDFSSPTARQKQAELEAEFRAIEPLPQSAAVAYDASHKTSQALVLCSYRTPLAYETIKAHYDTELAKRGWNFYEEEQILGLERCHDGREARYCKGEYRAHLRYTGQQASDGGDYAFSMSWGLDSLSERLTDKFRKVGCR